MFADYLWVSGTTEAQRRHFADLAVEAAHRVAPRYDPPSVLDIGCNDGTLLDAFQRLGFVTHGVDPAKNLQPLTLAKGHRVRVERWSPEVASALDHRILNPTSRTEQAPRCAGRLHATR